MTYSQAPRMPRNQVVRDRLLARIERAPVATVVSGPSGFGKTTLAGQWTRSLKRQGHRYVWITVDHATEPSTFWWLAEVAFADALGSSPPDASLTSPAGMAAMLSGYAGPVGWVIDGVGRELPARLVDDVFTLVAHTPNLRLLMCADGPAPPILAAQLNLDVDVVPTQELAFTHEETRQLLEAQGAWLADDLVALLRGEVEGWPLLVGASVMLLPERPTAADVRRVTHQATSQLAQHYLTAMDPSHAEFFLRVSVADRLTPAIAETMTGVRNAGRRLHRMTSTGVMTRSDSGGEVVYAFPAAVRNALRDRFRDTAPDDYRKLLESLTLAHLEHGEDHAVDALRSALRSEEIHLITKVVQDRWLPIFRGDRLLLADALARIPPQTVASSRALTSAHALALGAKPPTDDQPDLPSDPRALTSLGTGSDAAEFLLHGTAISIAVRRHGTIDQTADRFDRLMIAADAAYARREPQTLADLPTIYTQAGFTCILAGRLGRAQTLLKRAYELREYHRPGYAGYDAAGKLALVSALEGDMPAARRWLEAGDEHVRSAGRYDGWLAPYIESARYLARAVCHLEDGRFQDAAAALERGPEPVGDECGLVKLEVHALHGQLAGATHQLLDEWTESWRTHVGQLGETESAAAIAMASHADLLMAAGRGTRAGAVLRSCWADSQQLKVSTARWALLTGRLDEAHYHAGCQLWEPETHRRTRVHLQLISATVHHRAGRRAESDLLLTQAVALARRNGIRSPFAAADRDLLERRAAAVAGLSAMLADLDRRGFEPIFPTRLDVIQLSDREQAVLEALDTGQPVEKIAQQLFVSTNTVKTQMRSVYAKLGTHSRIDTLVKAREHGLLAGLASTRRATIRRGTDIAGRTPAGSPSERLEPV